jgi:hypothetical protein
MPLFIEGIGGTGKAVINLLKFAQRTAELLERETPELNCAVVDQDTNGIWQQVPPQQPIANANGAFARAFGITVPAHLSAARLLFSDTELQTNIGKGFHAHPKLAASLTGLWNSPPDAQAATHVLIYSDIGGTGAGLGPVRLTQLLTDPGKTHVIAIVFGKYLSVGTPNATGYEWLKEHETLLKAAEGGRCQWFTGFYISVPIQTINTGGTIPASGLNPAPALLLAVAYIWRLAENMRLGVTENFVGTNARPEGPARVEAVGFDSPKFRLVPERTEEAWLLPAQLRTCALNDDLGPLIPRQKQHLNSRLRQLIRTTDLPDACWQVFRSPEPQG